MKKSLFLTLLVSLLLFTSSFAQSTRSEREQAWRANRERQRALERQAEMHQDSVAYQAALSALKAGSWVLEANNVNFFNGITRFVSSGTNYISCNAGQGVVQTAFNNSNMNSPNGLGGVTLEGSVWGERMGRDENGNIFYSFSIQGTGISAVVYVTLTAGTNQASATVNANYSGNRMVFNGYLYPYSSAGIFEGQPSY